MLLISLAPNRRPYKRCLPRTARQATQPGRAAP